MSSYYCVCATFLFFVCLFFFTIIEGNLSQSYISFINNTKQVYMNKVMAQINANSGSNILGNSSFRNYFYVCFLFIYRSTNYQTIKSEYMK